MGHTALFLRHTGTATGEFRGEGGGEGENESGGRSCPLANPPSYAVVGVGTPVSVELMEGVEVCVGAVGVGSGVKVFVRVGEVPLVAGWRRVCRHCW